MGESKIKSKQIFQVELSGVQRHALFQVFDVSTNLKDREDRKRQMRAYEALGLGDFESVTPELDETGRVTKEAQDVFNAKIEQMGSDLTLTYENVDAALNVIDSAFKAGTLTGRGVRMVGPIEDLFEACKRGEHQLSPADVTPAGNGRPTTALETSAT